MSRDRSAAAHRSEDLRRAKGVLSQVATAPLGSSYTLGPTVVDDHGSLEGLQRAVELLPQLARSVQVSAEAAALIAHALALHLEEEDARHFGGQLASDARAAREQATEAHLRALAEALGRVRTHAHELDQRQADLEEVMGDLARAMRWSLVAVTVVGALCAVLGVVAIGLALPR